MQEWAVLENGEFQRMTDQRMTRATETASEKPKGTTAGLQWVPATVEDVIEAFGERMAIATNEGRLSELEARDVALKSVGNVFRVRKLVRA